MKDNIIYVFMYLRLLMGLFGTSTKFADIWWSSLLQSAKEKVKAFSHHTFTVLMAKSKAATEV